MGGNKENGVVLGIALGFQWLGSAFMGLTRTSIPNKIGWVGK